MKFLKKRRTYRKSLCQLVQHSKRIVEIANSTISKYTSASHVVVQSRMCESKRKKIRFCDGKKIGNRYRARVNDIHFFLLASAFISAKYFFRSLYSADFSKNFSAALTFVYLCESNFFLNCCYCLKHQIVLWCAKKKFTIIKYTVVCFANLSSCYIFFSVILVLSQSCDCMNAFGLQYIETKI